ncbi:MAG: glycoside hydrolase family 43 protein [Clostridium sp.]|nr:glycoside hydrolase family 43 protein [Clostridium sp.]
MPYLFVHFKEKLTVDGEQVYFAVSKDGYNWEAVNHGEPMITCTKGEQGCRDIEIVRLRDNSFVILATDLCIVNRMDENHNVDWKDINHNGSKYLSMWRTDDLIHFSEQKLIYFGCDDFGCLWAPEVFYDEINDEYLIHWSSTHRESDYEHMKIYCCTTKDFESFSTPKVFFEKDNEILDSHLVKIKDVYHLFYKNPAEPLMNMHAVSESLYGEYVHDSSFESYMSTLYRPGSHEAPTTYVLPDGKWCLMLDFFGCEKEKMGYVPFVSKQAGDADFVRCPEQFTFPYGFKHGKVIEITEEEYSRLCSKQNR